MGISEKKMKIVINNYFKEKCDTDTSIREAFEKGFRIGVEKGQSMKLESRKKGKWIFIHPLQADDEGAYICSNCHRGDWDIKPTDKYCKFCEMEMDIYER